MMKTQYLLLFIIVILSGALFFAFFKKEEQKIAFVNSTYLVEHYKGMQEARKEYQTKVTEWEANVDSMKLDLQRALNKYETDYDGLSKKKQEEYQNSLVRQKESLEKYISTVREKAQAEDERITQGALNQINSFVEKYAQENGYALVLGTTLSGNILYGEQNINITEDLLKSLNEEYTR